MTTDLATLANAIVSLAYFAITYAIMAPLLRTHQLRSNRLGAATAAIFFSCAVRHGFHAFHGAALLSQGHGHAGVGIGINWLEATADLITAGVAVYYWTLRRTYGSLMQGAALFEDVQQQRRLAELEHREALKFANDAAERERDSQAAMLEAVIANSQSLIYVKDLEGRYLMANKPFERAFGVRTALLGALARDAAVSGAERPGNAAGAGPGHRLRILLAEDNVVNQKVARLMLARLGHDVDVVGDGEEAVAALAKTPYEVVLMDVQMPQMDGLEATRILRADLPAGRQPHVVALTASAMVEDRQACAAAGMDDYLTKPFRQEQLAAVLSGVRTFGPDLQLDASAAGGPLT